MNKRFFSFLVAVGVLAAFTGCSSENYRAEKAFYHATKVLKGITAEQVKADPENSLAPAIAAFEKIVEEFPTKQKAAESLFKISDLSNEAQRVFTLTRIGINFEIFDTDDAAIESFSR